MRRVALALVLAAASLGALLGPAAPTAQAQNMGTFSWMPAKKVEEAMEKELRPAIYVFMVPGEPAAGSLEFQFTQPVVIDALGKYNFACCKVTISDQKSTRPWGTYQKIADEFGVSNSTTLVFVAHDRKVMYMLAQVVKRDDFVILLNKQGKDHKARIEVSEQASTDLDQVEKWIGEVKFADAARRLKSVMDKEKKLVARVITRMKELDAKLDAAGKARFDEAKALLDADKKSEAKPMLEELSKAFGASKYAWVKEIAEALKKAK